MAFRRTGVCIALVMGLAALPAAQNAAQAEKQFQAALQKEMVTGDLKGAIAIYRQVVAQAGSNRSLAARALLRMAECHQKLGNAEAQKIYQQIVRDYADQAEAAMARVQIEPSQELTPRRLWTAAFGVADITLNGTHALRRSVFVDQQNLERQDLILRNVASGQESLLVDSSREGAVIEARFSPDAQRVAFVWGDRSSGGLVVKGRRSLRVVGTTAGSEVRTIAAACPGPDVGSQNLGTPS